MTPNDIETDSGPPLAAAPISPPEAVSPMASIFTGKHTARVFVPLEIASQLQGHNASILLSQLLYWLAPKLNPGRTDQTEYPRAQKVDACGEHWVATSSRLLQEQTGLSCDQVKRSLAKLRQQSFIYSDRNPDWGQPRLLLCPGESAIQFADRADNKGVLVPAGVVRMTGTAARALVFGQILYWHEPDKRGRSRLQVKRNGHLWLAKTYSEMGLETGLSKRQAEGAVQYLRQRGLICTETHKFKGVPTLHIRLNRQAFWWAWRHQDDAWQQQLARREWAQNQDIDSDFERSGQPGSAPTDGPTLISNQGVTL